MNQGLWVVIGMSIAYLASFMGMIFAWIHYKRHQAQKEKSKKEQPVKGE